MGHDSHDSHGHDSHGHDSHGHDSHGHDDHHAPQYLPYKGMKVIEQVEPIPPMGSKAFDESVNVYDKKKNAEMPVRSNSDRLVSLLSGIVRPEESPAIGLSQSAMQSETTSIMERLFHPYSYPLPRTYTSPYLRPNPCPEVHWWNSWRWPKYRQVNPKIQPPIEGAYNDFYHFLAFKHWFEHERAVYYQTCNIHHDVVLRCMAKEGKYNGWKNCRHLLNKEFAMTREAEHNQMLMYMAVTGNNAIRETPYPEDFVEQKRKIHDNWLFRTRMRKPGDAM